MISIVTGTLNRLEYLPKLIQNTVDSNKNLELVLVDGGSEDGTIEYLKELNHPKIKFIEVGHRSNYPHYMNLGIRFSSYEIICQWNDDVILINNWDDVINEIDEENDFYLFNWKYGDYENINNSDWLDGNNHSREWFLLDLSSEGGEIVLNYGLYKKKVFRKIGMYNNEYKYYYADGDMSYRAHKFGFKHKTLRDIKVCSLDVEKTAKHFSEDSDIYQKNIELYNKKIIPDTVEYLGFN